MIEKHPGKAALAAIVEGMDDVPGEDWEAVHLDNDPFPREVWYAERRRICLLCSNGPITAIGHHIARCGPNPMRAIAAYVAELEAFKAQATHLVGEAARKQGEAEGKLAALEGNPASIIEGWRDRAEKAEKDAISLLSIIADIRAKSGVGDGPMLTELADAIKAKTDACKAQ